MYEMTCICDGSEYVFPAIVLIKETAHILEMTRLIRWPTDRHIAHICMHVSMAQLSVHREQIDEQMTL